MRALRRLHLPLWLPLLIAALACNMPGLALNFFPDPTPAGEAPSLPRPASASPLPAFTATPLPTPTATPTVTPSPLPSPSPTPFGCLRPPDDYTRFVIHGMLLNARTLWMLDHAQQLYGGAHDFRAAITQGSYNPGGVSASFGTHDGGGAVDLSVRDTSDRSRVLSEEEQQAVIRALRQAGFAAWVRETDELYPGSPIHIHAIAIGDAELSEAAQEQLTGPAGYFRGFNGLPEDPPIPDRYGEAYLCPWMIEMGYRDLRGEAP